MNIKNYSVVVAPDAEKLVELVTAGMNQGFQPIGGVSVAFEPATTDFEPPAADSAASAPRRKRILTRPRAVYTQAMVKLIGPEDVLGRIVTRVNGG